MKKDLEELIKNNSTNLHVDNTTGSWGTDPDDGKIVADILRGVGDLIKVFLGPKR